MEIQQIPKVPQGEFRYERSYSKPGVHPYDAVKWEIRDAVITDHKGQTIFEQKNVEVPSFWSQTAANIVASKYFRGRLGTPGRESSVKQLIGRVAGTIARWGKKGNYFLDEEEAETFESELTHTLLHQMAAFNSPVWFNVGVEDRPQCSACFINSVQDDMRSIMQLAQTEGMLFKYGSGTGSNLSSLRSSKEHLSTGGKASGPVSFMKGFDAFAGVIKSGGRTHRVADVYKARNLMREMAEAAYICGDPGIQFDTIINKWHPCPNTNRINASNPCSEYMFLDDSACNLASLNLMRFRSLDGGFDVESFEHAVEIVISAQEILVGNAGYPTPAIEKNSHDFRPLGLGYANLGALLMARGLPYDSDEGRNYAAAISALMSGRAYAASSRVAKRLGPFKGYAVNEKPFLNVVDMHRAHAYKVPAEGVSEELSKAALRSWDDALSLGERFGFKNAQISVIAPTGTIAFMMDCDTTGIEPDIALIKYKWLVGGGVIKIVNNTVPEALTKLGYSKTETSEILKHLEDHDTIEGAPHLKQEHLPVFDCAFKPAKGTRSIHYMGHVKMMAAVQPFISGAISKTVNMPGNVTVDEIVETYITAWKMGLKAIAIYRDGSKR